MSFMLAWATWDIFLPNKHMQSPHRGNQNELCIDTQLNQQESWARFWYLEAESRTLRTTLAWQLRAAAQMLARWCTCLIWKRALNTSHCWDQGEATRVSLWADSECRCRYHCLWKLSSQVGWASHWHSRLQIWSRTSNHPYQTHV